MAHARKLTPETLALIKSAPMPSDVERLLSHCTALEEELKAAQDEIERLRGLMSGMSLPLGE